MKIRRYIFIVVFVILFFLTGSILNTSDANAAPAKKTPPGLLKTPGVVATQNAVNHDADYYGNPHGKPVNYQGTITAVDETGITLELKDGTSVTIVITPETTIKIPKGKSEDQNGLASGLTVMVHAILGQDDSLTARSIVLIPKFISSVIEIIE